MPKLAIICGHGAGDPGAGGGGYDEADLVRQLGHKIAEIGGSDVLLLDTSRNWYEDGGVSELSLSCPIVELHMDSADGSARGGHIIIKNGTTPDIYDENLSQAIGDMFPGRSNLIVGRDDLANINRAYRRGLNYRLAENGFIDNTSDRERFINDMEQLAQQYCRAFGIDTQEEDEMKESDFVRIEQIIRNTVGEKVSALALAGCPLNDNCMYYQSHVANVGWTEIVRDGQIAGSTGQGAAIEAIKFLPPADIDMTVSAHMANLGWKDYKIAETGTKVGTTGEQRAIEALKIESKRPIKYRAHVAGDGWQKWVSNGEVAGTVGESKAIEAFQLIIE